MTWLYLTGTIIGLVIVAFIAAAIRQGWREGSEHEDRDPYA